MRKFGFSISNSRNTPQKRRFCTNRSETLDESLKRVTAKDVIFSGIQPTGSFHLGNYLGAVQNWIKLQNSPAKVVVNFHPIKSNHFFLKKKVLLSIVDLHSLTGHSFAKEQSIKFREQILNMATSLLATGINPNKVILYRQSQVWFSYERSILEAN
jgi:tryptophanyl-tRNA synthetase